MNQIRFVPGVAEPPVLHDDENAGIELQPDAERRADDHGTVASIGLSAYESGSSIFRRMD